MAGDPQGSVMSPYLHTTMTCYLSMSNNSVHTVMYADDICLFSSNKSAEIANRSIDNHINGPLMTYLAENKMKINSNNTETVYMTISLDHISVTYFSREIVIPNITRP